MSLSPIRRVRRACERISTRSAARVVVRGWRDASRRKAARHPARTRSRNLCRFSFSFSFPGSAGIVYPAGRRPALFRILRVLRERMDCSQAHSPESRAASRGEPFDNAQGREPFDTTQGCKPVERPAVIGANLALTKSQETNTKETSGDASNNSIFQS